MTITWPRLNLATSSTLGGTTETEMRNISGPEITRAELTLDEDVFSFYSEMWDILAHHSAFFSCCCFGLYRRRSKREASLLPEQHRHQQSNQLLFFLSLPLSLLTVDPMVLEWEDEEKKRTIKYKRKKKRNHPTFIISIEKNRRVKAIFQSAAMARPFPDSSTERPRKSQPPHKEKWQVTRTGHLLDDYTRKKTTRHAHWTYL